jgi:hypothetical protein
MNKNDVFNSNSIPHKNTIYLNTISHAAKTPEYA